MAKELLLYGGIYNYTAETFITSLEENKSEDIKIRFNCPGGDVFAGWGMIAKMKEFEGTITGKVDGYAASMGAMMLLLIDDIEVLDVSRIMFHRADGYVSSPEQQAFLDSVNKDLKSKLTKRIDGEKLKKLKGVSIDQIFDPTKRIDVWLSATEAQELGLVNKIIKLSPSEAKAKAESMLKIAAEAKDPEYQNIKIVAESDPDQKSTKITINKTMTLAELKAQHPAIYAEVIAEGVAQEKDRVEAWMTFVDVDPESVSKGISEGKPITSKAMAEFSRKAMNSQSLQKIENDSATTVKTKEVEAGKTQKKTEVEAFEKEVKGFLNLKTA